MDSFTDYEHPELLGGGMSRVYRATRRQDGRVVALKSVALASEDVARAERRGAELQRQFHTVEARVPDVYDIATDGAQLLIEMEYIEGDDLSTLIRQRGRLDPPDAVRVALSLADVLDHAHRFTAVVDGETFHGIVHGDLKPRNVRVVPRPASEGEAGATPLESRIRVLDFGVAKGIRGAEGETRNVFGSAPYMSPERLIGGHVSPASDCWSLGVVLCEMLTGRVPYQGGEREVLEQIERGLPALPPDCPPDLCVLASRLLARDLRARLASAGAVRDELARWLDQTRRTGPVATGIWIAPPVPPLPSVPGAAATADGETRRTQPQAVPPVPRARRRRRLAVMLALAAAAWIVWHVGGELRVWHESGLLGRRVYAAEPDALEEMVSAYTALTERSSFGVGTWPAREPLRSALILHVDRVILDYRQPEPTVRENQWKQARTWAKAALELGADSSVRARYLLCDAHAKRIDGDAAIRRGQGDRGRKLLNESVSGFQEAARITRNEPDAWLGLLRVQAMSRNDPEAAQVALNEAGRRGYAPGPREFFLMGEATRLRAEALERGCSDQRSPDQMKKCYEQARDLQSKALGWYDKALGFSTAARSGASSQKAIERLDQRLEILDESSSSNIGLDLLKLAVKAVEAHQARKP